MKGQMRKSLKAGKSHAAVAVAHYAPHTPRTGRRQVIMQPQVPGEGSASSPTATPTRYCPRCDRTTHFEAQCWLAHPEIKGDRLREIAEKKKARASLHTQEPRGRGVQTGKPGGLPRRHSVPARGVGQRRGAPRLSPIATQLVQSVSAINHHQVPCVASS